MPPPTNNARDERLTRLLSFLAHDPNNCALLRDTAEAALAAGDAQQALMLFARAGDLSPLGAEEQNLMGHAALRAGEAPLARSIFATLLETAPHDPALRFNLAWSYALEKDFEAALTNLNTATITALAQAATLQVQALHALGRFDEAADAGRASLQQFPDDRALAAAVSVLALDIEDEALAEKTAAIAGDLPDALATRAALALKHDDPARAQALFEEALARNPQQPRALIGLGLTQMLSGDAEAAATRIEDGARLFEDHIGSWIAAGWARLFANDLAGAKRHFEKALAIDHSFGETHGSLAVLAMLEGDTDLARQRAQTAQRLDRQSYSAALATAMIAASAGNSVRARTILDTALRTPIDASGRTLAHTLAAYGLRL
ncbi:MAG: tetratricopeptide repeat protein [Terricaulis sp.]